jgi:hypothetical protein
MLAPVTTAITRAPAGVGRGAQVALRVAALALLVIVLATVHIRTRPASLCVLRTVTGVPCPFCGGTTAATELGRGDLRAAAAASPLALGMLVLAPLAGLVHMPFGPSARRSRLALVVAVLATAEVWQLFRFGLL